MTDTICTVLAEDVVYKDTANENTHVDMNERVRGLLKKNKTDLIRMLLKNEKTVAEQAKYIKQLEKQITNTRL